MIIYHAKRNRGLYKGWMILFFNYLTNFPFLFVRKSFALDLTPCYNTMSCGCAHSGRDTTKTFEGTYAT